ncbi:DUF6351 family protein [Sinimarinibacterium sp. NLF-5-8]|uniref:DUF6351 family protein n=1 Tax=Sinimarinibacterium sp. NLF-5-8 TaxID=2698684 RepID=UPI00137BE12E|nr:DUF6351 family protein [Sinimarinibacterium sp. NLF-5-8]QHS10670.1 hypothetical protein GT972_11325 [Sinimarinibacterium sp. NLF-5-8]
MRTLCPFHRYGLQAACLSTLAAVMLAACSSSDPAASPSGVLPPGQVQTTTPLPNSTINVLSNRADLVSGGDVLIGIDASADQVQAITLNGLDVRSRFARAHDGSLMGLVEGLALGKNTLRARLDDGEHSIEIINHPNSGPIFAGPQLQPWVCGNADAVDEHCNQPPVYEYFYKPSNPLVGGFKPYDVDNPPSDVAMTTTDTGQTVPFILRQETGYQDRDQYRIMVLYQPGQPWTAQQPQPQFNHKLLINHGASCGVAYRTGGAPKLTPSDDLEIPVLGIEILPFAPPIDVVADATEIALGRGFALMSTALDNSGHNCNVALQAESLVMAKERVIEQYGTLRYTIGQGCSGGALAQQQIANAYPGIYQGILPTCSFPDAWSTATQFADYHLLLAYFQDPSKWGSGIVWLPTQMADVQGHITIANSIVSEAAQFHVAVPTDDCSGVSDDERYHPDTNPGGVRCSITDAAINLLGPRPRALWSEQEQAIGRGFAGFPVDNVGVQYGLKALQAGTITPAQFIDLNQKIGGMDMDTNLTEERLEAVEPALSNAYRTGMINVGNNLNQTAIIDCRGPDPGFFHDAYRAYAMRARLDREHGNHDNQLIWEGPIPIIGDNECAKLSFTAMDQWLEATEQDARALPIVAKLSANKPAGLGDRCYSGVGIKLTNGTCPRAPLPTLPLLGDVGANAAVVALYQTPRMIAGDAISTDTNKCQLKPLSRDDNYGLIPFTAAQWEALENLFPTGVCDFSKPAVSFNPTLSWQTYQNADRSVIYGGTPMPPAPARSGTGWASRSFGVFGG